MANDGRLVRRLGVVDATMLGLAAMVGAGVFTVFAPAAAAAGSGLLIGLAVAAVVAYCNATSSARLAARYPQSGGTYVYGRERLGPFWGYLAGWAFVVGKTASCAAIALTIGNYLWPGHGYAVGVAAVVLVTSLTFWGVQRAAWVATLLVAAVLAVLAGTVVVLLAGPPAAAAAAPAVASGPLGVLRSAGLLFFAFAGYARIATLGEEVKEPAKTIPRAIAVALAITLVSYLAVAVALLHTLGPARLAQAPDPLAQAAAAAGLPALETTLRVTAIVAASGSLLALLLGVTRTVLAMARDRYFWPQLAAVHPRRGVPHNAEVVVAMCVIFVFAVTDLTGAIGFSSFGVLCYYAVTNASALTLSRADGGPPRVVPVLGLLGCLLLAALLPLGSVISGSLVLGAGAVSYLLIRRFRAP